MVRALQMVLIAITSVVLVAVVGLVVLEATWTTKAPQSPQDYFLYGSTGTELMPLPVFQVLPDLFPDQFQPAGKDAGDWVDQFGFIRGQAGINDGLPVGISVTHYRPKSGAPSPVEFVGFNCAICHTAVIRRTDNSQGTLVYGMGNPNIDLVAFGDAVKTSLLDEKRLTVDTIESAYETKLHKTLGPLDKLMITVWLQGVRQALKQEMPMRNQPFGGADLRNASLMPSGPGRNQPMKETVRFLIDETPEPDGGSSKIPCLYEQHQRDWAQYDGSLRDPITRNSLAALGVGASIYNLRVPGILETLNQSYIYIRDLHGPAYSETFKDQPIDHARASRGQNVYMRYCSDCHGWPGAQPGEWIKGKRQNQVTPVEEIGTDSARVTFRFYPEMAQLIYGFFPDNHPLKPKRSDLRPNPGDVHGYINQPIGSAFSRAPYLHNGSVATLAELINLEPRRPVLYRGSNLYDPARVGLLVSDKPDALRYFRYDTQVYGNSNKGHDYPWAYHGAGWNENDLKDLLEYLKTL
jgi:hypothetical protein